jgi:hypothetical protein
MGNAAEGTNTLEDLRRILGFVQIDCEETIVRRHVQRWLFAGAQEM